MNAYEFNQRMFRLLIASVILLFIITPFKVSAYNISTNKLNYTSGETIFVSYNAEFSIIGGSIGIFNFSEIIDYYSGSSKGYVSGNGTISAPFYNINWNTKNITGTVKLYYENNTECCNTTFNVIVTPTPTPTPIPITLPNQTTSNNTSNQSKYNYSTNESLAWSNYSNQTVSGYNSTIYSIFQTLDYPFASLRSGIQYINSSFNNTSYNISYSFLNTTVPIIISSIPDKIKALITTYLIMLVILIILGRD